MKIAQISPLFESVPPSLYGGTERVVAYLCDALVELGHDVTLFASAESRTKARLVPVRSRAIRLDPGALNSDLAAHLSMLAEVRRRADAFDILHFHVDMLHLPLFEAYAHKSVTTVHGRMDFADLPAVYERWAAFGLISVSDAQRQPLPAANWIATIPHGLPAAHYTCRRPARTEYLAFLGRMSPEKRPELAIRLAITAGMPLKIAAKVDDANRSYFASIVEPLLQHPLIEFVGEISDAKKSEFLGNARALLFPISWPEPFGLVMIEAMACGTPVIAYDYGSVPEVIEHGLSGFVVHSDAEALQAIAHAGDLDRLRIRAAFEARFTSRNMADCYLGTYARLLDRRQLGRAS